jgi:hypothetical protein
VQVVGDDRVESDEQFSVNFTGLEASGRAVSLGDNLAAGVIQNDDVASVSIGGVTLAEETRVPRT